MTNYRISVRKSKSGGLGLISFLNYYITVPDTETGDAGSKTSEVKIITSVCNSLKWSFCRHLTEDVAQWVWMEGRKELQFRD